MWFFMVILLLPFPSLTDDVCTRSVLMSENGHINVTVGQPFNLTCNFTCLPVNHKVQLLKNNHMLCEVSSCTNCVFLLVFIPVVQLSDSGQYKCQSVPPDVISSVTVNVVSAEHMETTKPDVMAPPVSVPPSEARTTCNVLSSWNAPLWYLLCKTSLFIICSLSVVVMKTC